MEQTEDKDGTTLKLIFTMQVPSEYFSTCFDIEKISLEHTLLNLPYLKECTIINLNKKGIAFFIESKVEIEVDVNNEKFNLIIQKNKLDKIKLFFALLNYYGESVSENVEKLSLDMIQFIGWSKGLKLGRDMFENLELDCAWRIREHFGDLSSIHDFWTVLEVETYEVNCVKLNNFADFYKIRLHNKSIPLYYELLVEAEKSIHNQSIRSGLLILFSALEIATKMFISQKVPGSNYIINKMQSPPLESLYREYIIVELAPIMSKDEIKVLSQMVNFRNNIAHQGIIIIKNNKAIITLTVEKLHEYLFFVKTIIMRIDRTLGNIT